MTLYVYIYIHTLVIPQLDAGSVCTCMELDVGSSELRPDPGACFGDGLGYLQKP
jgi:hypothetical protein